MKKYYEVLAIGRLSIEIDDNGQPQPTLQRIKIKVFEHGVNSPSSHSHSYSKQLDNRLVWDEVIELPFTGQKKLGFEVYCQSKDQQNTPTEDGAIFRGVYYIKEEKGSKLDSCHVYSAQGEKKGLLRWEVKRTLKEEIQVVEQIIQKVKPTVPQDLIGMIKVHQASLEITNSIFNKKKHSNLTLIISFGDQSWHGQPREDYKWDLKDVKIEYMMNGSTTIEVELIQDDLCILSGIPLFYTGSIQCESIRKMKRYMGHSISMLNKHSIKVGTITLELRYMDKQELIVFLTSTKHSITTPYLPERTPKVTPNHTTNEELIRRSQEYLLNNLASSRQYSMAQHSKMHQSAHRSDMLLPKTTRFPSSKPNSPYVSYIDPEKLSDFSPKRNKGWDMSRGRKFDFTRQYRGNPGVGSYKLPSIWGQNMHR